MDKQEIIKMLKNIEAYGLEISPYLIINSRLSEKTLKHLLEIENNEKLPQEVKDAAFTKEFYTKENLADFYNAYGIESIIPEPYYLDEIFLEKTGIIKIPDNLFKGHTNAEHITVPNQIREIGTSAFEDSGLEDFVREGDGELLIGEGAFCNCTKLSKFTFPEGTEKIGRGAFAGCVSLEEIFLPGTIKEIGEHAFAGCTALKTITIPTGFQFNQNILMGCKTAIVSFYDVNA